MGLFDSVGKAVGGAVGSVTKGVGSIVGGALGGLGQGMGFGGGVGGFSLDDYRDLQKVREESLQRLTQKAREEREKDMAAGRARGEEIFGKTYIEASRPERSADVADVLARRKAQLQGLSAPENTALREQMAQKLAQSQALAQRKLAGAQAAAGVRGGLATAQQAQVGTEAQRARAEAERQLFLENIAQRQAALDKYEASTRAAEQEEIGRYGQRQYGKLATELGYGQLGAAERAGINTALIGESQAAAAAKQAGQGGKK